MEKMQIYLGDDMEQKSVIVATENVPTIITRSWGNLTEEKYKQLKKNPSWLQLTAKVCDSCYVKLTEM